MRPQNLIKIRFRDLSFWLKVAVVLAWLAFFVALG